MENFINKQKHTIVVNEKTYKVLNKLLLVNDFSEKHLDSSNINQLLICDE